MLLYPLEWDALNLHFFPSRRASALDAAASRGAFLCTFLGVLILYEY